MILELPNDDIKIVYIAFTALTSYIYWCLIRFKTQTCLKEKTKSSRVSDGLVFVSNCYSAKQQAVLFAVPFTSFFYKPELLN